MVGIKTPSNAFFVIAFAFLLLLVLHFSSVVSRLSDETRVLAQRLALLQQRVDALEPDDEPVGDRQSSSAPATSAARRPDRDGRDRAEPSTDDRAGPKP